MGVRDVSPRLRAALGIGVVLVAWLVLARDPRGELEPPVASAPERATATHATEASASGEEGRTDAEPPPPAELGAASVPQRVRTEPAASPPSAPRPAETTRGRLVDARTLEPIADALVAAQRASSRTDADGWFDTGEPLDALDSLDVLNVALDGSVQEAPRASWARLDGHWLVPLAIGPTYRVRLRGLEEISAAPWEGRLSRGGARDGRWMRLASGPLPFLRLGAPIADPATGEELWVEVRSQDGFQEGRGAVHSTVGVHEVDVECLARAVLVGRVLDERGAPCRGIPVSALQRGAGGIQRVDTTTDERGAYRVSAAEPGAMSVVLLAPARSRPLELSLRVPRGVTRAPDQVIARGGAGTIRGSIRCTSGAGWVDVLLRLRALDGSGYEQRTHVGLGTERALREQLGREGVNLDGIGLGVAAFRTSGPFVFEDVPAGRFELSAETREGYTCSPAALEVEAPATGLSFTCDDGEPLASYRLRVVDAESGAPVVPRSVSVAGLGGEPRVRLSDEGGRFEAAASAGFECRVFAAGYRAGRTSERDFLAAGDERVATCALRRGFGARLVVEAWTGGVEFAETTGGARSTRWNGQALSGAEVFADGVRAATSDEQGAVELELDTAPARLDVRLPGWRVVDSYGFRNGVLQYPEARVRMIRE